MGPVLIMGCVTCPCSDHFMQVLNCKQNCVLEMATIAGKDKPFEDFLPSLLNYLQFSYFNSMSEFVMDSSFSSYWLYGLTILPNL